MESDRERERTAAPAERTKRLLGAPRARGQRPAVEVQETTPILVAEGEAGEHIVLEAKVSELDRYQAEALKRLFEQLPVLLTRARETDFEQRVQALWQALLPEDPLADAHLRLVAGDALARQEFLAQVPVYDSKQVAGNAGHVSANAAQTAYRWRREGRIFAVTHGGTDLYPAFQFGDDGQPRDIIAQVLTILAGDPARTAWQNAFWFVGANGWLDGAAPVERLDPASDRVLEAARQAVAAREQ